MTSGATRLFLTAWTAAEKLPEGAVRGVMHVAAELAWLRRGAGVRRLEDNLARARPGVSRTDLRRLSRRGMRTYLRYYGEAFRLGALTPEQVTARVRLENPGFVTEQTRAGRSVVLALAHQGNWDLAGAWATTHLAPVTTVAEHLEPAEVFDRFVALRERLGMRIIPLDADRRVFSDLVRTVRGGGAVIPLLADRDLTARGLEVAFLGERARVAAGPAALAAATGAPLVPVTLRHERLHGARRRAAGSRWGLLVRFHPPVTPGAGDRAAQVQHMTQQWVDALAADIVEDPTHWHMLQRVFVADLDPDRLTRVSP
ncbi:phosphatidylinositol mannoside acyltransferase [Cellulomonas bogoriensis]|uniref:Lipid A biosynthesis acyltransferase n=1 Tax=Cellulomonas bogoriensis 69B4 = DSM 16987 TaxID=1386082 RepID=A0A0A0C1A0_9CELL|nr:phosphatidylinositol mannoside acyltransferase [Cellulomonas bogoriensis]KGM13712.1 lipid A biosynthesis acyltransferase [Cellulomonas bogoriensis 69B4 = DSM 16987]